MSDHPQGPQNQPGDWNENQPPTAPEGQPYSAPEQGQPHLDQPTSDQRYSAPEQGQWSQNQPPQHQPQSQPGDAFQPGDSAANQPYGGAGQFGAGQPPHGQPGDGQSWAPPAEQQAPKKSPLARLVPVLIALALVFFGPTLLGKLGIGGGGLKVGSCITVTKKSSTDYDNKKADCDDANTPSFQVVQKLKGGEKCDSAYTSYTFTSKQRFGSTKETAVYCLMDNLAEGKCYKEAEAPVTGFAIVECGEQALFKVAKRIDGTADEKQCTDQDGVAYPADPKRTYCLADPTK